MPKYTRKQLVNMSDEELLSLASDKELLRLSSKIKPVPSNRRRGNRTTPTQQRTFTLPDGRTIETPTFPENPPTSTSRDDYYTCENDWCCNWDGSTDYQNDMSGNNYVYHQADFSYSYAVLAYPQNFLYVTGTIYIDGVPSTNPLLCNTWSMPGADCDLPCNSGANNCDEIPHPYPEGSYNDCILPFATWDYTVNPNTETMYCSSGPISCDNPGYTSHCHWDNYTYPNYGMNYWNEPTGNADAIAAIWNGTIVGFDFVNNVAAGQDIIPGISIPLQHRQGYLTLPCYPNVGDKIDNLILYKADTGTYYQLTQESYQLFLDNVNAFIPAGGFSYIGNDLYFEPYDGQQGQQNCFDCKTICPDWYNDGACSQECEYFGKSRGCRYNYEGTDNPNNGCFCNNSEAGCCDEGAFLPEPTVNKCRTNRDCRQGSVCIRNRCVLEKPPTPTELDELNCRCTKINNCDEIFGVELCNMCSDLESDILNNPNYTYSDGQAYCEYEFPNVCDGDGNCGNSLCNFSCNNRAQRTGPKPSNRRKRK